MWYVIQTTTGKEQELVDVIGKVLGEKESRARRKKNREMDDGPSLPNRSKSERKSYKNCFIIRRECVWKIEGKYQVHIEPLFPSYVFVETDTPEQFFYDLKRVPKLTKLLGSDGAFWAMQREEEELLRNLMGNDSEYVVRRSQVRINEEGEIIAAEGMLKDYLGKIVKKRLRKRVVVLEVPFLGESRRIEVGVKVEGEE